MNYSIQVSSINQRETLESQGRGMLVIIDPSIADSHHLVKGILTGVKVLQLDPDRDGIQQISDYLQQHPRFTSLHLICHGSPASLYLGSCKLSLDNLEEYSPLLEQWGRGWSRDREILLYGCQVAKNSQGREFVKGLSDIISAPIAASIDLTGNEALGGTWELAYRTGEIQSNLALQPEAMATYPAVLATENIANGDIQDLINKINAANGNEVEAVFNLASNGTYEFTEQFFHVPKDNPVLSRGLGGLPSIYTKITINGNNSILRRNSSEEFRFFYVDGNGDAQGELILNNVILEGGSATAEFVGGVATGGGDDGGAIFNDNGKVTINNSTIRNNTALDEGSAIANLNGEVIINGSTINANLSQDRTEDGGAIENDGASATLIINSSTLSGNQGDQGGAIRNRNGGTVTVNNSTLTQNTAFRSGGGIYNHSSGGTFTVKNSIIAGNTGPNPDVSGAFTGDANNLIGDITGSTGSIGGTNDIIDNSSIDQILNTTLAANGLLERDPFTHALAENSPAIDTGSNDFTTDQRGALAIGQPDIGAYETGAQSSGTILDSESNTVIPDDTGSIDFGTITQGNTVQKTFKIQSTGTLPFSLGSWTLPNGFSVVNGFPNSVQGTGDPNNPNEVEFTVQLDGTNAGSFSGDLSVQTNDSAVNNPYNFNLTGTVVQPTILQVIDPSNNNALIADDTGTLNIGTTNENVPLEATFIVKNPTDTARNISNISLPNGFTLIEGSFPATIAANSEQSFKIQLDAATIGNISGELSLETDDPNLNNPPYNFNITATVFDPDVKLRIFANSTFIPDDTGTFQFTGTNKNEPIAIAFTLKNVSDDTVSLSNFSLPDGFNLVGEFPDTIAGDSETTFTVQLDASTVGNFNGQLSFLTDDTNLTESTYNFDIGGIVNALPEPTPTPEPVPSSNPTVTSFDRLRVDANLKRFTTGNEGGSNLKLELSNNSSDRITQISIAYLNGNGDRTLTDVLFTALPSRLRPNGFNANRQTYLLEQISSNQTFEIELQTIDGATLTQEISFAEVSTGRFSVNFAEGISLFLEQTNESAPLGVGSIQKQGQELLDLRSISGAVRSTFSVYREAVFNNSVGFFLANNENGTVNGLNPGDNGYAEAAINNRLTDVELFVSNQGINEFSTTLTAGSILIPFIIINGTAEQFLANNAANRINSDIVAYFPFIGANPDQADHIRLLANNTFGFEDLSGGGDQDFNDIIIETNIEQI